MNLQNADEAHVAAVVAAGGFTTIPGGGQMTATPAPNLMPHDLAPPAAISTKRPIKALNLVHIVPGAVAGSAPEFEWVDPAELLVDEGYQRTISERSLELIRKMVGNWDWRRFKPPIVARTPEGLMVVDGQHTAIGAATHPDVPLIPVMVVGDLDQADQAKAFVGHNKDRLQINKLQIHHAALAAGDEDALTIDQVCQRAGVRMIRSMPGNGVFKPCDTMAVGAIGALINRRGAQKARIVLQVLAEAKCAPLAAGQIKAIEMLLHEAEYRDQVLAPDLTSALLSLGVATAEQEAKVFAAAHNVPVWRALGIIIYRRARRGRRSAG